MSKDLGGLHLESQTSKCIQLSVQNEDGLERNDPPWDSGLNNGLPSPLLPTVHGVGQHVVLNLRVRLGVCQAVQTTWR